ncbi:hypothetical protein CK203_025450 [Vitis vinifera]|uniref:Uncharacterized protein n=1 Tax=Vitis vinifera TaxID=29760 RepID=A0A438IZE1_VITVI|nr:hypothetical protein CK203_025450 [Vitis vinifera]
MVSSQQGPSQMDFGAREVVAEAPQALLAAPEMALGDGTGEGTSEGSGDCSVNSMGFELSTLALFCSGRPPDLVR